MAIIEAPLKQVMFIHMDAANEPIPDGFALCDGSTLTSGQQDINPGGSYTVPDLRNMFILCADSTKAFGTAPAGVGNGNLNLAAGAPGPGASGGAHGKTLGLTEIPAHSHTATTSGTVAITDPGHGHTLTDSGHSHTLTDPGHSHAASADIAAAHSHGVSDPGHFHTTGILTQSLTGGSSTSLRTDTGIGGSSNWPSDTKTTGIAINNAGSHSHAITINSGTTGITQASATTGITLANRTTGITASLSATTTTSNAGGGSAYDTRPRWYGLVAIIRVKV